MLQHRRELITDHILKDVSKDAKILEVYCNNGHTYKIIKNLGYKNYTGIDDNLKNIINCKSMFGNKRNFIYCENIDDYISKNKFDVIFCIGPCRQHALSTVIKSAKSKIFYYITRGCNNSDYHEKICLLHRKLSEYTNFSWKIFDNKDYSDNNRCTIVGMNYSAFSFMNSKYLIVRDVCRGIVDNMKDTNILLEILSMIVEKYTLCNSKIKSSNKLCIDNVSYIYNDSFNIIVPLEDNIEIEMDNNEINKHILDKGDIILINKLSYFINGKYIKLEY